MTSNAVTRRRCKGRKADGSACRNRVVLDSGYCKAHTQNPDEKRGFGGSQPTAGRPRVERPTEVAVRMIEERLQPLIENHLELALEKMYDPNVRRAAGKDLLQYGLGMPTQRTEVSGPGGGPVSIASLVVSLSGAAEAREAARNGSLPVVDGTGRPIAENGSHGVEGDA